MVKKLKELSNVDIDRMLHNDRGYGGCMSKDDLPRTLGRKFYILNMQDSEDGGGTHWTLLDNRQSNSVQYFDSMGQVPPKIVKRLMRSTGKKQIINKFELQPMGSVTCGWWAIAAAKALGNGMPMADFITLFDMHDFKKNDKELATCF